MKRRTQSINQVYTGKKHYDREKNTAIQDTADSIIQDLLDDEDSEITQATEQKHEEIKKYWREDGRDSS